MKIAEPKVGSVIRYSYLWLEEAAAGAREGRKDRPSLVLAIAIQRQDGATEVMVVAITHARPRIRSDAVEISDPIKRGLGLDAEPAWIVTNEANVFVWPGPDLRAVPARTPATPIYGEVPAPLLKAVAQSYVANRKRQKKLVRRDD